MPASATTQLTTSDLEWLPLADRRREVVDGLLLAHGSTRADCDAWPDDGRRHELIDGVLVVGPAPVPRHQIAVGELVFLLRSFCPADLRVLFAPVDVSLDAVTDRTVVQPDVLVARRVDFDERGLPVAPLLAVEVLSPSTRRIDLGTKRSAYEAAGCPSYWVVDPDRVSMTAWELLAGAYVEVAHVVGDESFEARLPFAVTVTPSRLLD